MKPLSTSACASCRKIDTPDTVTSRSTGPDPGTRQDRGPSTVGRRRGVGRRRRRQSSGKAEAGGRHADTLVPGMRIARQPGRDRNDVFACHVDRRGWQTDPHQSPPLVDPNFGIDRIIGIVERHPVDPRAKRTGRRFEMLCVDGIDSRRDVAMRRDIDWDLGSRPRDAQTDGERLVGGKQEVR